MLIAKAEIAHQCQRAIFMAAINKTCLKVPIILYFKNHGCFYYKANSAVFFRRCV